MIGWWTAKRRRWQQHSGRQQVEATTRWLLVLLPWFLVVASLLQLTPHVEEGAVPLTLTAAVAVLGVVQCSTANGLLGRCVDGYLGTAPPPRLGAALLGACLLASLGLVAALVATESLSGTMEPGMVLFGYLWPFGVTYGMVVRPRIAALTLMGFTAGAALVLGSAGLSWRHLTGTGFVIALSSASALLTGRSSAWYIAVLRELEEAQEVQARLAVAEERLRFGRDLHDVMGRNLSAIALKSELAVQLAQRAEGAGAGPAVAQMTEVQRLARESQAEVRAVVRGYREAGLHTELAGARGILRAAGVDCRVAGHGGDGRGGERRASDEGERLPEAVRSALGWVVREGATNVLLHADASYCTVRVDVHGEDPCATGAATGAEAAGRGTAGAEAAGPGAAGAGTAGTGAAGTGAAGTGAEATGWVRLTMANDGVREAAGRGDDADARKAGPGRTRAASRPRSTRGGSGLAGLRERLAALGGTLTTDGDDTAGTFRLTAEVPLGTSAQAAETTP